MHLIEADARKSAFLREAARLAGAPVTVHTARVEALDPWPADALTARAIAPLPRLLGLAAPFLAGGGCGLFLKGREAEEELTAAGKEWNMRVERFPSRSDPAGTILRVRDLTRAPGR